MEKLQPNYKGYVDPKNGFESIRFFILSVPLTAKKDEREFVSILNLAVY